MRYLLVTDGQLPAQIVARAALPDEPLSVLCTDRNLARRLKRRGLDALTGDLAKPATWRRAHLDDETLVVVALQRQPKALEVVDEVARHRPDVPVVVLDLESRADETAEDAPFADRRNVERVSLSEIVRTPFQEKFANAWVRKRVHEYRDHFKDADRVIILTHDDPDPDAIAAALGLRALLGRNRQTAIIGAFKLPTRPENVRMCELLGVEILEVKEADVAAFDRVAVVDTQPHIFGGKVQHADLVIDHHPQRSGYTATFKDIRTSFGATSSLIIDYMLRAGVTVSERIATAAVYAIKTDTWAFRRGSLARDVEIFAHVFPRADQALLRRIEMEGFTLETLAHIADVATKVEMVGHFMYVHVGDVPRDDLVPTTADFLLTLAESHWTAVSGVLGDDLVLSMRNLGYQRSAGELVQQFFSELGAAGGHRSAAKAILPLSVVRERFGEPGTPEFNEAFFRPLYEAAGEGGAPRSPNLAGGGNGEGGPDAPANPSGSKAGGKTSAEPRAGATKAPRGTRKKGGRKGAGKSGGATEEGRDDSAASSQQRMA